MKKKDRSDKGAIEVTDGRLKDNRKDRSEKKGRREKGKKQGKR